MAGQQCAPGGRSRPGSSDVFEQTGRDPGDGRASAALPPCCRAPPRPPSLPARSSWSSGPPLSTREAARRLSSPSRTSAPAPGLSPCPSGNALSRQCRRSEPLSITAIAPLLGLFEHLVQRECPGHLSRNGSCGWPSVAPLTIAGAPSDRPFIRKERGCQGENTYADAPDPLRPSFSSPGGVRCRHRSPRRVIPRRAIRASTR